ncbi:ribokinase [Kribbella deserti]|uniref:Ribokinase n=1 Tax=Kribbella deserti TaxID=1926257 RepID=A0ABV6QHE0_9ACTN
MSGKGVVVVGSANVDLVLPVQRIPRPGETVLASGLSRGPGGKGANQAVAASRAGATTRFVVSLGDDEPGELLRAVLSDASVDLSLASTTTTPTGTAIITVDADGENAITVAPAANADLRLNHDTRAAIRAADVVLAQLEIPFDTVREAARESRYFVLNAAPAAALDDDLLADVDLLVVNEHEASVVAGTSDNPGEVLLKRVPAVVITLGGEGALVLTRDAEPLKVAAVKVEVVDTTAAGDTFCGVLAATLATGSELPEAVRRATVAASLSVQAAGAIPSVPTADDIAARYAEVYP